MEGHGQVHCPDSPTCPQGRLNLCESPGRFFMLHAETSLNSGASFLYVFFFPLGDNKRQISDLTMASLPEFK